MVVDLRQQQFTVVLIKQIPHIMVDSSIPRLIFKSK